MPSSSLVSSEVTQTMKQSTFTRKLEDAYEATNKNTKTALEKYVNMLKPKEVKHPIDQIDPTERALHYWRWAFDKVIE